MVYILLGSGFEEAEAVIPCDLLRRAGIETLFAGIGGHVIRGSHGITVQADALLEDIDENQLDMLILPGGMRGVQSISRSEAAASLIRRTWNAGKYVAAICAAPTILAKLGISDGLRATCYPGMEDQMQNADVQPSARAVRDGRLITSRAAGTAFDFSLELIRALKGNEAARKVAEAVAV